MNEIDDKFYYVYSSSLDHKVEIKVGTLEGKRAKPEYDKLLSDPMLKFSGLYQEGCSDLYVTCQVLSDGVPLALPVTTSYKAFSNRWNWNEWVTLPVFFSDLPRNAILAMTIYDCAGPGKVMVVGGTTISLFGKHGMLRQGMFDLRVWPGVEGSEKTPGKAPDRGKEQMQRLGKLAKKHRNGHMPKVDWLDRLTFREIEMINEKEKRSSDYMYLMVEFPTVQIDGVNHAVVYYEQDGDEMYQFKAQADIVTVPDYEILQENLIEAKQHRLARSLRSGVSGRDAKPTASERDQLSAIVAAPPATPLTAFEQDLLWKFRFYLSSHRRALTKFLECVNWNRPGEVRQALSMMKQWAPMDVEDALELLTPKFSHPSVRKYAISRLKQAPDEDLLLYLLQLVQALKYENKNEIHDEYARIAGKDVPVYSDGEGRLLQSGRRASQTSLLSTSVLTNSEALSNPAMSRQLSRSEVEVSAIVSTQEDNVTTVNSSTMDNNNFEIGDPSEERLNLATFLISRACNNPVLANYLYWYLLIECEGSEEDTAVRHMYLAVMNTFSHHLAKDTGDGTDERATLATLLISRACNNPVLANYLYWYLLIECEGSEEDTAVRHMYLAVMNTFSHHLAKDTGDGTDERATLATLLISRACNNPVLANYLYWYLLIECEGSEEDTAVRHMYLAVMNTFSHHLAKDTGDGTDERATLATLLISRACNNPVLANYLYWYLLIECEGSEEDTAVRHMYLAVMNTFSHHLAKDTGDGTDERATLATLLISRACNNPVLANYLYWYLLIECEGSEEDTAVRHMYLAVMNTFSHHLAKDTGDGTDERATLATLLISRACNNPVLANYLYWYLLIECEGSEEDTAVRHMYLAVMNTFSHHLAKDTGDGTDERATLATLLISRACNNPVLANYLYWYLLIECEGSEEDTAVRHMYLAVMNTFSHHLAKDTGDGTDERATLATLLISRACNNPVLANYLYWYLLIECEGSEEDTAVRHMYLAVMNTFSHHLAKDTGDGTDERATLATLLISRACNNPVLANYLYWYLLIECEGSEEDTAVRHMYLAVMNTFSHHLAKDTGDGTDERATLATLLISRACNNPVLANYLYWYLLIECEGSEEDTAVRHMYLAVMNTFSHHLAKDTGDGTDERATLATLLISRACNNPVLANYLYWYLLIECEGSEEDTAVRHMYLAVMNTFSHHLAKDTGDGTDERATLATLLISRACNNPVLANYLYWYLLIECEGSEEDTAVRHMYLAVMNTFSHHLAKDERATLATLLISRACNNPVLANYLYWYLLIECEGSEEDTAVRHMYLAVMNTFSHHLAKDTGDGTDERATLATLLISRACNNPVLANYLYWYLLIECEGSEEDTAVRHMYLAVMNTFSHHLAKDTGDGTDERATLATLLISRACNNPVLANYLYWYLLIECEGSEEDTAVRHMYLAVMNTFSHHLAKDTGDGTDERATLATLLISRACNNPVLANYLYWYLLIECEGSEEDTAVRHMYLAVMNTFSHHLAKGNTEHQRTRSFLARQQVFIDKLVKLVKTVTRESGNRNKKAERLQQLLADPDAFKYNFMNFEPMPFPLDPNVTIKGIVAKKASLFKSSLMPSKLTFLTTEGSEYEAIFKHGDDLRQDQLILQMITLMDKLLRRENLDLKLTPYKVLATSSKHGFLQFIESVTVAEALATEGSIQNFFRKYNPCEGAPYGIKPETMDTYIRSCAGYCVITYLLGVGDRHLDNLLLTKAGALFHIDFGYILGRDPKPLPPPMKLSKEMVEAMGGVHSEHYHEFRKQCYTAFLHLRRHANLMLNLFSLMVDASVPDIALEPDKAVKKVQDKLRLDLGDEEAVHYLQNLLDMSVTAVMAALVEHFHKFAQYWRK
ncbi:hypothetical protein O0L34_g12916 [Tuta absoluta]|nr:hypothetical protein O0L34_g12916 [Tuta absoluta]